MNASLTLLRRPALLGLLLLLLVTAPTASAQIAGTLEGGDSFGNATATGDFDGDNFDDLAVGAYGEDINFGLQVTYVNAGAVNVVYGSLGQGLIATNNQFWHQNSADIEGTAEAEDWFGEALAVGDFDGDGYDDLAIGAPREDAGSITDAGVVHVIYGSSGGLTAEGDQLLLAGNNTAYGRFGHALAAGDFNGDGYDDLAIGEPGKAVNGHAAAGVVKFLYGSLGTGLTYTGSFTVTEADCNSVYCVVAAGDQFGFALATGDFSGGGSDDLAIGVPYDDGYNSSSPDGGQVIIWFSEEGRRGHALGSDLRAAERTGGGVEGGSDPGDSPGDRLGWSLAAGDFDGDDHFDDLAAGAPYYDPPGTYDAGGVAVYYDVDFYIPWSFETWHQDQPGLPGTAEDDEGFGWALASGDFDGDDDDDLAVGIPFDRAGTIPRAGAANVLYGTANGLDAYGSQLWHQDANLLDGRGAEDRFGYALAAGDFDTDGYDDLAAGVVNESFRGATYAGAANVLYGAASIGLTATGNQLWYQGSTVSLTGDGPGGEPEGAEAVPSALGTETADALALLPPAPNPFRGATTLRFTLAVPGAVRLTVYDALGRAVAVLVDETREAGPHTAAFDASALPSGAYLVRLEVGGRALTQRLTLLR
jgi:hypothetical protein